MHSYMCHTTLIMTDELSSDKERTCMKSHPTWRIWSCPPKYAVTLYCSNISLAKAISAVLPCTGVQFKTGREQKAAFDGRERGSGKMG